MQLRSGLEVTTSPAGGWRSRDYTARGREPRRRGPSVGARAAKSDVDLPDWHTSWRVSSTSWLRHARTSGDATRRCWGSPAACPSHGSGHARVALPRRQGTRPFTGGMNSLPPGGITALASRRCGRTLQCHAARVLAMPARWPCGARVLAVPPQWRVRLDGHLAGGECCTPPTAAPSYAMLVPSTPSRPTHRGVVLSVEEATQSWLADAIPKPRRARGGPC